jgi:hypothetical protein
VWTGARVRAGSLRAIGRRVSSKTAFWRSRGWNLESERVNDGTTLFLAQLCRCARARARFRCRLVGTLGLRDGTGQRQHVGHAFWSRHCTATLCDDNLYSYFMVVSSEHAEHVSWQVLWSCGYCCLCPSRLGSVGSRMSRSWPCPSPAFPGFYNTGAPAQQCRTCTLQNVFPLCFAPAAAPAFCFFLDHQSPCCRAERARLDERCCVDAEC